MSTPSIAKSRNRKTATSKKRCDIPAQGHIRCDHRQGAAEK